MMTMMGSLARHALVVAAVAAPAGGPHVHADGLHTHGEWTVPGMGASSAEVDCSAGDARPLSPLKPLPLAAVRIGDSAFGDAQALNTAYLQYLDLDRLLWTFRTQAGLPSGEDVAPYGGWESPNYQWGLINGHFTGHLISALAFAAGSGDDDLRAKGDRLVAALEACQDAVGTGWLSAYPLAHLERLEAHNTTHVWAPYYTLHKIGAGLLDFYEQAGSAAALRVATRLADYLHGRITRLIASKGESWWDDCLETEYGGMNEFAYSLYAITREPTHLELASLFYKRSFLLPLARGEGDPLLILS